MSTVHPANTHSRLQALLQARLSEGRWKIPKFMTPERAAHLRINRRTPPRSPTPALQSSLPPPSEGQVSPPPASLLDSPVLL